jgi:aminoglycoside phosphotransferase
LSRYLDQVDGALVELLDRLGAGRHDMMTLGHSGASVVRLLGAGGRPVDYLKAAPSHMRHMAEVVDAERARLDWLRARGVPVPEVMDWGREPDLTWVLTKAVPGVPASTRGLRLSATGSWRCSGRRCIRSNRTAARSTSRRRPGCGRRGNGLSTTRRLLGWRPPYPTTRRWVGRGDYCLPNVLLAGGDVHVVDEWLRWFDDLDRFFWD